MANTVKVILLRGQNRGAATAARNPGRKAHRYRCRYASHGVPPRLPWPRRRFPRGAIVDDDHLEVGKDLAGYRRDCATDVIGLVKYRNDDGDARHTSPSEVAAHRGAQEPRYLEDAADVSFELYVA